MTRRQQIYQAALDRYGIGSQTLMLAEECSELIKAASKACRYFSKLEPGDPTAFSLVQAITEEMADVEIMMEQIKQNYMISNLDIERWKEQKIQRLAQHLGEKI